MSSSTPTQQRLASKPGFPLRLLVVVFVITLSTIFFSGWQSWQHHRYSEEILRKHIALTENVGRIMLLDEKLTMSARMAAATGDFSYEKRYDQFYPQLTMAINDVRVILPQTEIARFVRETDEANLALVKMERQAFAWEHQGKRQEAAALLTSAEYLRLKKVYAGGIEKTVNATTKLIEKETLHLHFLSFRLALVTTVGALLLLVAWIFAARSARSWAAERREVASEIRKLNEELEIKVLERTQQLLDAQDELVRKEKLALLGQVAGSVGHELRNPLGVMSNAVYYLQTVLTEGDDSVKEYLGIIHTEIIRSEHIVNELLDAVRTRPSEPTTQEVAELVGQVLRQCVVPESVTLTLDIPETLPPVRVDAIQIQQVLRNLINNGVQAMAEGGTLVIRAVENRLESTVTVSVHDNGNGIAPEHLDKLFQPLFTTKARGIGLGLVVVKNLIEANGGTIEVESVPGEGSRFFVTLPSGEGDKT